MFALYPRGSFKAKVINRMKIGNKDYQTSLGKIKIIRYKPNWKQKHMYGIHILK